MNHINGTYAPEKDTWARQSSLQYGNWSPFDLNGWKREGFCAGGCGTKYNNSTTEWTVSGNITPANGNREGYHRAVGVDRGAFSCSPGIACQFSDTDCNIKRPDNKFIPGGFLRVKNAYTYSK